MGLVDDEGVVLVEVGIRQGFGEKDAVGHQFDGDIPFCHLLEPDLVADGIPERGAELFCDAFGNGGRGNPSWLRTADDAMPTQTRFEAELRNLGGLARSRLPCNHHHRMLPDGRNQLVFALADGKALVKGRLRECFCPFHKPGFGPGRLFFHGCKAHVPGLFRKACRFPPEFRKGTPTRIRIRSGNPRGNRGFPDGFQALFNGTWKGGAGCARSGFSTHGSCCNRLT